MVPGTDYAPQLRMAFAQRRGDIRQVDEHRLRRLVAVARILAQHPLDDFIQGPRDSQTQAPQFGSTRRHVLQEHPADALTLEGRTPGQALEKHYARRIQIGRFGHFVVEGTGLLG